MTNEPDYKLTIIEEDGNWVVCEAGEPISKPFEDKLFHDPDRTLGSIS